MSRWPLYKAFFWEYAPFFRVLLPFVAGIYCYDAGWAGNTATTALWVVTVTAFGGLIATTFFLKNRLHPAVGILLLSMTLFSSGALMTGLTDARNKPNWFGYKLNRQNTYLVRIADAAAEKESTWKLTVDVLRSINNEQPIPATGKAFIYLYKDNFPMLYHKGDTILVPGNWQPVTNAGNPFEFDYARYCRRSNIAFQQFCSVQESRLFSTNDPTAASFTTAAHDWCLQQLDRYINDRKTRGLIQAMLLGDEVNLDEDLRQSYADTGIVHVIAISGGNVMLFFYFISYLLWWLRHNKYQWLKFLLALPLVWIYVIMAGASPSAIRAAFMFSLLALGIIFQKNNNSLNQLFAASFLLLIAQPMWLFSAGFQLSFVAVLSLIIFYRPIYKRLRVKSWYLKPIWKTIAASLAAEILVAPLVIYYFHNFPVMFLVANVLAFLFMGLVLFAGIGVIILSFIPLISTGIGIGIVWTVKVFGYIITWLQAFNPVSFHYLQLSGSELFCIYIIVAGISLFLLRKQKKGLFTALATSCIFMCLLITGKWNSLQQQDLIVYNTAKTNWIETISGDHYSLITADTSTPKIKYATTPAHIALQAWKKSPSTTQQVFRIGNKTILVLNEDTDTTGSFPVDYLILNNAAPQNARQLQRTYSPKLFIIGNNYNKNVRNEWAAACVGIHQPVHIVGRDGAFVLGHANVGRPEQR